MSKILKGSEGLQGKAPVIIAGIVIIGLFSLLVLHLGLTRYYNAQQVQSLVDEADANGQSYSLVIHNGLTGSYSFKIEE